MKKSIALHVLTLCSMCFLAHTLQAQTNVVIKGRVTTQTGEPLSGVTITIKGSAGKTTTTTTEGSFQLNAPAGSTLLLSYVGYITNEVKIGDAGNDHLTVQLVTNKNELDQVVVVGYGTRKKRDVTGSITSVSEQSIRDVPAANLSQALQGQGAGIDIQKNKGNSKPGQAPTILIRGSRSVKAGNSPLLVLDGIPYDGNINDINQDDVSSVEVLKDASSTAIYGSRGANGVILISTKRGKAGRKPVVTYSGYAGFEKNFGEYPMMNSQQYIQFKKWAYWLGKGADAKNGVYPYTSIDDPKIITDAFAPEERYGMSINRSTDWQKLVYRTGIATNHQLGVTGGTDVTQYAMSGGYYKETGVYPGQSFERYSLKVSVDQQLGKIFKVGVSSLNSYTLTKGESNNPMGQALRASPLAAPYDSTGALINYFLPGSQNQVWNPFDDFLKGAAVENRKRLGTFTTLYLEANLAKGLRYKFNAGTELRSDVYGNFYATNTTFALGGPSKAKNSTTYTTTYTLENLLLYDKTIADKHKINFTGLFSYQDYSQENASFTYTSLLSDNSQYFNPTLGFNLAADPGSNANYLTQWALLSYMARVNYSYDDKYLLTVTMRSDGSSRLAPGNKYHIFPSAAVAWNMTNENFLKGISWLSNLKLRGTYGAVGNTSIDAYATLGSLNNQVYNYGGNFVTGLYPNSVSNPTLGWEYTSTANIGLDFGLLNNRVSGAIDVYHSYTKDMILPQTLPGTSGVPTAILTNIGKSENQGIEVHVSTVNLQSTSKNGVTWTSDFNFAINHGKITRLDPFLNTSYNGKPADLSNKWFVGQPIGAYYDYQRTGIWQANGKDSAAAAGLGLTLSGSKSVIGQAKIADRNGNGQIDAGDMYIVGSSEPKWEGGTTQRVTWRNIDLTVVAFARMGGMISSTLFGGGFTNTMQSNYNNVNVAYWTPNNPTNDWSKPNSTQTNPTNLSTFGYFDGSFLKIRSLGLGYTLPQAILRSTGAKSIRVYATAHDPFILFSPYRNKYHGIDPETAGTLGVDTPATWSMVFGINITL